MNLTDEDRANILVDVPPRSLRTDRGNPAHLNDAGRRVSAEILAERVREVGWVPPATDDYDADGVADSNDNCPVQANPTQTDTNPAMASGMPVGRRCGLA